MNTPSNRTRRALAVAGVATLAVAGFASSPGGAASLPSAVEPSGPACAAVPADGEGSFDGMADDPAATAASNNPELSTLVTAVDAAGLVDVLNGEGPFTIFAPANSAFAAVPPADLDALLADPTGALTDILTLHVVAGEQLSSADLAAVGTIDSIGGTLTFAADGDALTVDGGGGQATVVCADIPTANATVHIIDAVLLPGAADVASMTDDGTTLYNVDLASGAATAIGPVGDGLALVGLAIDSGDSLDQAYGLTDAGELVTFSAADPSSVTSTPITGLGENDPLLGIDVRPVDGSIVALSGGGVLYTVDPADGSATAVGEGLDPTIESPAFGFDFNPTVDRIRVDVATGQNLRVNPDSGAVGTNPDTGAPTIDGTLTFADGDANAGSAPRVVGAGYTNSVADAEATELYVIDAATGSLALQDPPNDGVLNTVGALGVEITEASSFDIAPSGEALLAVPANAFGGGAMALQPSGPACAAVPADGEGSFDGMADDPAATAASNNPELSTLVTAVDAAGLVDVLNGEGPFTIFAPANSAFAAVPPADLDALLADPTGALTDILTLHVVAGEQLSSADLAAVGTIDSIGGTLTFAADGDALTVDGGGGQATVVCADIPTANATVHIIDAVLLPGS